MIEKDEGYLLRHAELNHPLVEGVIIINAKINPSSTFHRFITDSLDDGLEVVIAVGVQSQVGIDDALEGGVVGTAIGRLEPGGSVHTYWM